ncbi:hypothetical protein L226DRAFT_572579 [Lentinus tigrinus ALCF2SS1-7]|uniref:Uncharacterized protein n=1 Tax=Lentinus tigrinus ALCF2SS1-6 TaxID=1328759 RepID=A0A5C2S158_9APHY|nr:hypothetical protein L227DRAFT_613821 [Lentinus tigrinus ALCF2SS1-6]RPD73142.1 hypothetical protein L226DRAFT_572579 [Lentinus tigrinus ALCF2SS1-7]
MSSSDGDDDNDMVDELIDDDVGSSGHTGNVKEDINQWIEDIGRDRFLRYVPTGFGPKRIKKKRTGAAKPVKAATSSGKKGGPSSGNGKGGKDGKSGKEKVQRKGVVTKAKVSEKMGKGKDKDKGEGVEEQDSVTGVARPQRKADPLIDALFPLSSEDDDQDEDTFLRKHAARACGRNKLIELSDVDDTDTKPIELDDDDDDDDDDEDEEIKPPPPKRRRKSEPNDEGQTYSAYIMLEPDEAHTIPKTSLSRFQGKATKSLPPSKPTLRGPFEFGDDVSYWDFMDRFATACRTLRRRLEPEEMTWQYEKPANSPNRPLTDESGYRLMLKQLKTNKVKVINIRHPAVKENIAPPRVQYAAYDDHSEDEYDNMRRSPTKYSVQAQLLATERSLRDPMRMLEDKYPEGNYLELFPGNKKRWYAGADGLFWELTRSRLQAWATALSDHAPGVDINTPPVSIHFARKQAIKPRNNAVSTPSSAASGMPVSAPIPSTSSITLDATSLLASLFSSASPHVHAPFPNQIPALGISPALAQQLSMLSTLSQPALTQPLQMSFAQQSSAAQQLPALAQPAITEQLLALAQHLPVFTQHVPALAPQVPQSTSPHFVPSSLPRPPHSETLSAVTPASTSQHLTHIRGEGELGFTFGGWQCLDGGEGAT